MKFTLLELLVIIAVICFIIALLLPALGHTRTNPGPKRCTNNLKQIGLAMIMYFSDSSESHMPHNNGKDFLSSSDSMSQIFELDAELLSCPASRKCPQYQSVYIIQKEIAGASIDDFENPDSRILMDGDEYGQVQVHKSGGKMNVLFGDGHVEAVAP
jgi:prepilin-type processing-associated H-X9-DG protein